MESIKIEYIVIFNENSKVCTTKKALNMLLQSDTNITIKNSDIMYRNTKIKYSVEAGKINDSEDRFFHIQFILSDLVKIDNFEEFLKSIRTILNNNSSRNVEILWNDISYFYSLKSYPLIHEIENLMRKLITKIMIVTLGIGWTTNSVPDVVKDSIRTKKSSKKFETEYLYQTDFIQLSNFLFEEYSNDNVKSLINNLKSVKTGEDISYDEISKYIPKSNWERYFSKIVDCEYEFLKKKWEELYLLRCKVAHNNQMNKADYLKISDLVKDLQVVLDEAIKNIDKLEMNNIDKELISESMIISTNRLYGEFIMSWKKLTDIMLMLLANHKLVSLKRRNSMIDLIELAGNKGIISEDVQLKLTELRHIRNSIVHYNTVTYSELEISLHLEKINEIIEYIIELRI